MTRILRYVWQLPQNIAGLVLLAFLRRRVVKRRAEGGLLVLWCFHQYGGVSLGRYVFVHRDADSILVSHELGHCRQSLMLGPLYLLVIGVPSILWAVCHTAISRVRPGLDYYRFYTESWANHLANLRSEQATRRVRRSKGGPGTTPRTTTDNS